MSPTDFISCVIVNVRYTIWFICSQINSFAHKCCTCRVNNAFNNDFQVVTNKIFLLFPFSFSFLLGSYSCVDIVSPVRCMLAEYTGGGLLCSKTLKIFSSVKNIVYEYYSTF